LANRKKQVNKSFNSRQQHAHIAEKPTWKNDDTTTKDKRPLEVRANSRNKSSTDTQANKPTPSSDCDGNENELSNANDDDESTDLVWTPGVKQINLKSQAICVRRVIKASFKGIQKYAL